MHGHPAGSASRYPVRRSWTRRRFLLGLSSGVAGLGLASMASTRLRGSAVALAAGAQRSGKSPGAFELLEATIPDLQTALARGVVSSRDLVSLYLARIEAYDRQGPALNAISWFNQNVFDQADALDAERRATGPRSALHGIPVLVKDNYDTSDMQTAGGSILMKGWIPPDDAFLVTQLRNAGAIIIAKTNMTEWALGYWCVGSLFGQTRNPYALDRVPGGSSGGTGAGIAANYAAIGMGTDTEASIRCPAAENNLVGLRGTQGLLSRTGIIPLSHTQDIGGPLGRTVTDVATILDVLVGYDPADPQTARSVGNTPATYTASLQADALQGARIGLLTDLFTIDPSDPAVTDVVYAAADDMRRLGATVIDVTIPDLAHLMSSSGVVSETRFELKKYFDAHPTAPVRSLDEIVASGVMAPEVAGALTNLDKVDSLDTKDYYQALAQRGVLRQATLAVMADNQLDALIYPTIRDKPILIGTPTSQPGVNSNLTTHTGMPALTVPAGFTDDGLPVGVEFLGRVWSEPKLIALAYAYEQATHHRRPPASTPAL
jgi:amidase